MRRFLTLVCLLGVAIPAGFTISGCTRNPGGKYCNGLGYGLKDTDPASITITPQTTGLSLAFGQTGQISSPTAKTCKGTDASVSNYTYGTTNNQLVDISPTGQHLRRNVEPQLRRRHPQLHHLQLSQSASNYRRASLRRSLYHGFRRIDHVESRRSLRPPAGDVDIACDYANVGQRAAVRFADPDGTTRCPGLLCGSQ